MDRLLLSEETVGNPATGFSDPPTSARGSMNPAEIVCVIGWSHLLQPPVSAWMARRAALDLETAFGQLTGLARPLANVMAAASILLPTAQGLLLATHAESATQGAMRSLALLVAAFWTCRLSAQVWLWRHWPVRFRRYYWTLLAIFIVQGPVLGGIVLGSGSNG
jgi:hypothetical protein